MEQTTIQRVAELYKRKSRLLDELSYLVDNSYTFEMSRRMRDVFCPYGTISYTTMSSSFLKEIRKLTEAHMKQQIEEIDTELTNL